MYCKWFVVGGMQRFLSDLLTIIVSSANFGDSDWRETSVSFHSKEAHDWYVKNGFGPLWERCQEVLPEGIA
jgi:hypothetical protein